MGPKPFNEKGIHRFFPTNLTPDGILQIFVGFPFGTAAVPALLRLSAAGVLICRPFDGQLPGSGAVLYGLVVIMMRFQGLAWFDVELPRTFPHVIHPKFSEQGERSVTLFLYIINSANDIFMGTLTGTFILCWNIPCFPARFFLEKPASHEQRPGLHVDAIDICPGAVEVRLYLL